MSITYEPDPGSLVELQVAIESTYGTYQAPTVQIATTEAPTWGIGHQTIEGAALTSTIQKVITHAAIRGIEVPFVSFTAPLSANSIDTLLHMCIGSAKASNAWAVNGNPSGFTVVVHVQRPGSGAGDAFEFTGCRVASWGINMPLGGMPTIRVDILGRRLTFPDAANAAVALNPTTSNRPFILTDCTFKHATTSAGVSGATAVKFRGFTLECDLGIDLDGAHNSSHTQPDHLVRTAFDTAGSILGRYSQDWWDEWKAIIPDGSTAVAGGYGLTYIEFDIDDGTNILRLEMPTRIDLQQIGPDDRGLGADLTFIAAGDTTTGTGGAPTVPAIRARDV